MIFSAEQREIGLALVAIIAGEEHGNELEQRLTEIVSAQQYGDEADVSEAVTKLYRESPLWIRRRLFPNRHAGRRSMFQARPAFTKPGPKPKLDLRQPSNR